MRKCIFVFFVFCNQLAVVIANENNQLTYIWAFSKNNDLKCKKFNETLQARFDIAIRECIDIGSVNSEIDSQLIENSFYKVDYSKLVEKEADYLISCKVLRETDKNQLSVFIKLYSMIDSGNVSVSSINQIVNSSMNKKEIDFVAMAIVSEICPKFNADMKYLLKAGELYERKKEYLDDYKKMVDSVLIYAKTVMDNCESDTVVKNEITYDTIIKRTINKIEVADVLIPGYGLITSLKKRRHVLHSFIFNIVEAGSLTGGIIFVIRSENGLYQNGSEKYKLYGSSFFITAALTAVVNGIIVSCKLKKSNRINSKSPEYFQLKEMNYKVK